MKRLPVQFVALLVLMSIGVGTASGGDNLEEVLVTAQRRSEDLYRVPVSVAIVNDEALRATGARDLTALAGTVPNLSFDGVVTQTGGSTATSVYIRGIGQSDILPTTEPGVGLFVDGVYVSGSVGSLLDVADVERIEVLRGPQGTLFGRNTIGGAINVITRPPGDRLAVSVRATTGSDERLDSFVRLDAPVSHKLRTSISFATFDQDGYVARPNAGDSLGDVHRRAAHAQLAWAPRESIEVAADLDYTRVGEGGVPATLERVVQLCPANVGTAIGNCDAHAPVGAPPSQTYLFNNVPSVNIAAGGAGVGASIYDGRFVSGDPFINYGTGPEASDLSVNGAHITVDWKGARLQARSISGWRSLDAYYSRDTDASPFALFVPSATIDHRQWSEEGQLLGNADRVSWVAGAYYLHDATNEDSVATAASFTLQSGGVDIVNRSAALYSQADWQVLDHVALTFGGRYTAEHESYVPTQYVTHSVTGIPPAGLVIVPPLENELSFSTPTYRAGIELTPHDDLLVYASWSTGFKSGGFVERIQVPQQWLPTFEPETVKVFEVGAKAHVSGNLRLTGALFTGNYDEIQIRVIDPLTSSAVTSNAGDATIRGGEFEAEAAPHSLVQLKGGIGYLHGRYAHVAQNVPNITLQSRLTDTPEWSANLSVIAAIPGLSDSLSARIDWRYRSSYFNDAENTPELEQKSFGLLNVSATWRCTSCRRPGWSTTLGVNNATDERYIVSGYAQTSIGPIATSFGRPREWFLTVTANFGQ